MRVAIASIVSDRAFGMIVAANVLESGHPLCGRTLRLKMADARMISRPTVGETWNVEGEIIDSRWGPQVEARAATRVVPTGRLVVDYLASHVAGIGPERARALWDHFGVGLAAVLEEDARILDVAKVIAPDRPALAPRLAAACVRAWKEAGAETKTITWLAERGIEDIRVARTVHRALGYKAAERLDSNPYVLVPLLPWRKVDDLGLRVMAQAGCQAPRQDVRRLVGAVDGAIKDTIRRGDTAVDETALRRLLAAHLAVTENSAHVSAAMDAGIRNHAIVAGPKGWRAPGCAWMEDLLVARLARMRAADYPVFIRIPRRDDLEALLLSMPSLARLHVEQRAAVAAILSRSLGCLQGGAGTGKTTVTKAVCDAWERLGGRVALCAISGKAALRLSRATGRLAMTVARMLHQLAERERIEREILEADMPCGAGKRAGPRLDDLAALCPATLLIVDEASMLDLASTSGLLRRLPDGGRLLMVGDEAQLPPVGFGLVFHKLVEDVAITARLTVIHRQTEASGIPKVAATVRHSLIPDLRAYSGRREGVAFQECDAASLPEEVVRIREELAAGDEEVIVVTATNDGAAGVHELNSRLHALAARRNPDLRQVRGHFGQCFIVGDPVIFLRNDYAQGLFNGLLGRILDCDSDARCCTVMFDGYDRPHVIGGDDLVDLQHAYAVTCHRAQGSQAAAVIVPLYKTRGTDPSWLYTAITRAERQVVLVGLREVLREIMGRPRASACRTVGLTWDPIQPANDEEGLAVKPARPAMQPGSATSTVMEVTDAQGR